MLFLSSPVSISFASELQSAFVTLWDGNAGVWCLYARRYYNIIVRVMKSSLAPQSSWRVQFSVIAGKLNMAVSLPFQWGPSHIERRGGRVEMQRRARSKTHKPTHTDKQSSKWTLLIKVFHKYENWRVLYHSLTWDSPDTLYLNSLPKGTKNTVRLILLLFCFFPLQLLMCFKKHSYEQKKLPVLLEIQSFWSHQSFSGFPSHVCWRWGKCIMQTVCLGSFKIQCLLDFHVCGWLCGTCSFSFVMLHIYARNVYHL